jgi:hypothetical protein
MREVSIINCIRNANGEIIINHDEITEIALE